MVATLAHAVTESSLDMTGETEEDEAMPNTPATLIPEVGDSQNVSVYAIATAAADAGLHSIGRTEHVDSYTLHVWHGEPRVYRDQSWTLRTFGQSFDEMSRFHRETDGDVGAAAAHMMLAGF